MAALRRHPWAWLLVVLAIGAFLSLVVINTYSGHGSDAALLPFLAAITLALVAAVQPLSTGEVLRPLEAFNDTSASRAPPA